MLYHKPTVKELTQLLDNNQKAIIQQLCLVIRTGSHLYGTVTAESDTDIAAVFIPQINYILGLDKVEVIKADIIDKDENGKNTAKAIDFTLYEIRKYFKLLLQNNPNIIEQIFVNPDNIIHVNLIGVELLAQRKIFLHKGLYDQFTAYAIAQKKKMLIKKENYEALIEAAEKLKAEDPKAVLEDIIDKYEFIKPLNRKLIGIGDLKFNKGRLIKKVLKSINDRLSSITNRMTLVRKYGYDTKFAMHLIRLLIEGGMLLKYGELKFPLPEINMLMEIKNGNFALEDVLYLAETLETRNHGYLATTKLPSKVPYSAVNNLLIKILKSVIE